MFIYQYFNAINILIFYLFYHFSETKGFSEIKMCNNEDIKKIVNTKNVRVMLVLYERNSP